MYKRFVLKGTNKFKMCSKPNFSGKIRFEGPAEKWPQEITRTLPLWRNSSSSFTMVKSERRLPYPYPGYQSPKIKISLFFRLWYPGHYIHYFSLTCCVMRENADQGPGNEVEISHQNTTFSRWFTGSPL